MFGAMLSCPSFIGKARRRDKMPARLSRTWPPMPLPQADWKTANSLLMWLSLKLKKRWVNCLFCSNDCQFGALNVEIPANKKTLHYSGQLLPSKRVLRYSIISLQINISQEVKYILSTPSSARTPEQLQTVKMTCNKYFVMPWNIKH